MAALLGSLVISGSRLSTGAPNDTGTVWAYQPGTVVPAILYADAAASVVITQPITLDNGGRIPYDTYPDGVWITAPIRLLVQDASTQTVSDSTYWPSDARTDALVNAGWTGDTVDEALSAIFASVGGVDGEYQESGGATARPIQDKFREEGIWVTDFGAVGNGIAIDTTQIQTAMNRAKALSCALRFPSGTFICDQAITLSSATGVSIIGSGQNATIIKFTNASANGFTISAPSSMLISRLTINHATTSSGTGIAISGAGTSVRLSDVTVASGTFLIGASATGAGNSIVVDNCTIGGQSASSSARGFVSAWLYTWIRGGSFTSVLGASIEFQSAAGDSVVDGVLFQHSFGTTGILFNANVTGTRFAIYGCQGLGTMTTPIDLSGLSTDPGVSQWGNENDGNLYSAAIGNTLTILRGFGDDNTLKAASGGAGTMTVAAPTPTPSTGARGVYLRTRHVNAAGGAVTWSMNAVFVLAGAVAIPTTDAHTIMMNWEWDGATSKWRETSRSDTLT